MWCAAAWIRIYMYGDPLMCTMGSLIPRLSPRWNLFCRWHGCLCSDMVTVCIPVLHMNDSWSHHLLEQALHHCCQVGGFQCSLGACYSVSPFLCHNVMNCTFLLPTKLLWQWQISCDLVVWIFLFYKESTSSSSRWTSCPCWMHTKHHIRISSDFRLHGLMVHITGHVPVLASACTCVLLMTTAVSSCDV